MNKNANTNSSINFEFKENTLELHKKLAGKIKILPAIIPHEKEILEKIYTPGVAFVCKEIEKDPSTMKDYTMKGNTVAIVCNGTAVLGLGNVGPAAALPVIEGKALLLKVFSNINAFPICIDTNTIEETCSVIKAISINFGAIMLEDIKAPECIEIEDKLTESLNIPVFHDDQHGTAIVVSAALINALKVVKKSLQTAKVVVLGIGAAGSAIIKLLKDIGVENILAVNRLGIINHQSSS
jgi:malate dehydrogenase (oxaloacetate-decarboxylating)